ncbi:MAG: O-antigen ligase family protein [Bacteroidota bacterium]
MVPPIAYNIRNIYGSILVILLAVLLGFAFSKGGVLLPIALSALPFGIAFVALIIVKPRLGIYISLIFGFFANGIIRYVDGPFGLFIDIILVMSALGLLFRTREDPDSPGINNKLTWAVLIWFAYTVIEISNPEAVSMEAWFYAVRGVSLYFISTVLLTLVLLYKEKDCDTFIMIWFCCSLLGTLWGMKQFFIGLDAAENAWLESGAKITHILFGKLRIFSFYSDAGQFGAAQAHTAVTALVLALGPGKKKKRIFFVITAALSIYGMLLSGTRGALFVVVTGLAVYFLLSNNLKIIIPGAIAGVLVFCMLKFTFIGQGNDQIRRMRTALDPNDASLLVRLENQLKLSEYLQDRPMGGGIGSAGSWGQRFSPGTFLAETPLDSWYVKIWVESGIIGLLIYLSLILFILGDRFIFIFRLKDPPLRQKMAALYAGVFGICFASYGNQIFGQLPTGNVMYISITFLFLAGNFIKKDSLNVTDEPAL